VTLDSSARAALESAWQRSDHLFALLPPAALGTRPIAWRQPFLFYLGHLPAFAWNQLARGVLGQPAFAPALDALFERGIDPADDTEPDKAGPEQGWPALVDVLRYRDEVRTRLRDVLDAPALQESLPLVLEHELMHHETLLYMLQELPDEQRETPPRDATDAACGPTRATPRRVGIPAGRADLGAARDGRFRWDNEHPRHECHVAAFEIDALPVTNAEFAEFVAAGGYTQRRWWTDDGWTWVQRGGRRAPHGWRRAGATWRLQALTGAADFARAGDWPASVSQCEALAFTRWSAARLPTEAEFHRAAYGTPDDSPRAHPWGDAALAPEHGNLAFRRWEPTPAGSHPDGASAFGVHELVGNGWEWTATPFAPFPGFEPLARYPGYSADFFDGRHFVLLGGSWATDARLVRRSFRNWFQPHYPYVFAKFRRVYPA
jgi:ergothioneine biosynthesis protein EgtB